MKKLTLILFSLMTSLNSYGEWTSVLPGNNASLYIDFTTLVQKDEFIYWWYLDSWGDESEQTYAQGDCKLKGFKVNKRIKYSLPMGKGDATKKDVSSSTWQYYEPNTGFEVLLNFICKMSTLSPEEKKIRIDELNNRNKVSNSKEQASSKIEPLKSPYIKSVEAKIKTLWNYPDAKDNWSCDVLVNQADNGAVEGVRILGCKNGNNENTAMSKSKAQAFGASIRRAVFKASPLPPPKNKEDFNKELIFKFSAK